MEKDKTKNKIPICIIPKQPWQCFQQTSSQRCTDTASSTTRTCLSWQLSWRNLT